MSLFNLAVIALGLACLPAVLTLMNVGVLLTPRLPATRPRLAILIPARNEAAGIGDCVRAALGSIHADIEVVVLDDHSPDRTAEILATFFDRVHQLFERLEDLLADLVRELRFLLLPA